MNVSIQPLKVKLRTLRNGKILKTKSFYGFFDGDDTVEIYSDIDESQWIASVNIETDIIYYYLSKYSPTKPNFKNHSLWLPHTNKDYNVFKMIKVRW